uniref:DUF4248 domain-containing protein n=1 Tax=Strongyloides venezuelensis TaxID=75913 RepID=A0A0K0FBB4_STRVS
MYSKKMETLTKTHNFPMSIKYLATFMKSAEGSLTVRLFDEFARWNETSIKSTFPTTEGRILMNEEIKRMLQDLFPSQ